MIRQQQTHNTPHPYQIWRLPEVVRITGISRTKIYSLMSSGDFPRPIRLGGKNARSVGWNSTHVMSWLDARAAEAGYGVEGSSHG